MVSVTELHPTPCTVAVEIFSVTRLSMKVLMVSSQACSRECPVREASRPDSARIPQRSHWVGRPCDGRRLHEFSEDAPGRGRDQAIPRRGCARP